MTALNTADAIRIGGVAADRAYLGGTLVWGAAPPAAAYDFELLDSTGSAAFSDLPTMRVSINGGAWQTLSAAGLSLARDPGDPKKVVVSGFASTSDAANSRFHIERQQPGEPNSGANELFALWAKAVSGPAPVNAGQPGLPIAATDHYNPVVTT